jgi:hypothetical protein
MQAMNSDDLAIDMSIYPRDQIDQSRVDLLCAAIEAGTTLPPLLIGKIPNSPENFVVDGAHRLLAHQAKRREMKVECVLKKYRDKSSMLLDAIRVNAQQGKPLTQEDWSICLERGAALKAGIHEISAALSISLDLANAVLGTRENKSGSIGIRKHQHRLPIATHGAAEQATEPDGLDYDDSGNEWAGRTIGNIARIKHALSEHEGDEIPKSLFDAMNELMEIWKKHNLRRSAKPGDALPAIP